ncbi:hypothetical protein B0H67DRAFT_221656 [Lasiosphaeris hirsuta]|uniref:Uncharacterized protein n=1 Tax=Lasiosphaeris hirsuta TaxID=260670 RepID=A0AA40AFA4_9PEZI|nr:hypothetical protein B0H67DRAFT_221656 [Lasiosphaeris hirsuta]
MRNAERACSTEGQDCGPVSLLSPFLMGGGDLAVLGFGSRWNDETAALQTPTVLSHLSHFLASTQMAADHSHHLLHPHTSCNFNPIRVVPKNPLPSRLVVPTATDSYIAVRLCPSTSELRARITEITDNVHLGRTRRIVLASARARSGDNCAACGSPRGENNQPAAAVGPMALVLNLSWLAAASSRDLCDSVCGFSSARAFQFSKSGFIVSFAAACSLGLPKRRDQLVGR